MTKKHIDEIRGDLTTFNRLVNAVNFAVESFDKHDQREKRGRELEKQIDDSEAQLSSIKAKVEAASGNLKVLEKRVDNILDEASNEAANIIAKATQDAKDIIAKAEQGRDDLVEKGKIAAGKLSGIESDIKEAERKRDKVNGELTKATESLTEALAKVSA